MRVLFLNYEYPPLGGGAGNATSFLLSEYVKTENLKVDLVTSSYDESFHLERMGEDVEIHKLPIGKNAKNLHFQSKKDLLVYSWKAYWYGKKLIRKNKYDLTHSFFGVPCGFISLLFKIKYNLPYIVSLRGADVPGYSERFSFFYNFLKPIIRLVWKKASFVVSNSEGLKELALKSKPNQKIEVIYNGIDTDVFHPDESVRNKDKFIITLGGTRITSRKGIKYLIEAVHKLSNKYSQIHATIIGEGDEKENLEELSRKLNVEDKIKFAGRVKNSQKVIPYYREAFVFVLPSLNEGMSNAMLEALSSGLPIIATDTGGTKELVKDGENGFIVKMKSADDIAEKIEKLINDENLRERMGELSRQRALEMSWKNVAEKYVKLYKDAKESRFSKN